MTRYGIRLKPSELRLICFGIWNNFMASDIKVLD